MKIKDRYIKEAIEFLDSVNGMVERRKDKVVDWDWHVLSNISTQLSQSLNSINRALGALDEENA
jgi:hypothetical protein